MHPEAHALALDEAVPAPLLSPPLVTLKDAAEWLLGLKSLQRHYLAARDMACPGGFIPAVLDELGIEACVDQEDRRRIPATGPLLVVANHPLGAVEGLAIGRLLKEIRPDVKIMANHLLARIPELRDEMIFVDPFGGESASRANIAPLRAAARWLADGGALVVFPAGEVSSLSVAERRVSDPDWNPTVARLATMSGAAVLPIFVGGRNDWLFQGAGIMHPRLRTLLLPHALLKRRGRPIDLVIGKAIPAERISAIGSPERIVEYLRSRVYILANRREANAPRAAAGPHEPARPDQAWVLAGEIAALPEEQRLIESGDLVVLWGRASQFPRTLREIGRLREETFRAVGEGTGQAIDLDRFDEHYIHLVLWDAARQQVAGAYRLCKVDIILTRLGAEGLYTSTLFEFSPALLERLRPALEIGRAFVRAEYRRSYPPLMLLWKGIGAFVAANPRYSILIGPVSISGEYAPASRQLMRRYLERRHAMPELAGQARPRTPMREDHPRMISEEGCSMLSMEQSEVAWTITDIEGDGRGLPVLLRQYLKLGATVLGFNVDSAFADCVDALIMVDLLRTDPSILERYMGSEGAARFLGYQETHAHLRHEHECEKKEIAPPRRAARTRLIEQVWI